MIITFCGHSQFTKSIECEQKLLKFLHEKVGTQQADMYLGGYGGFDNFAYECCKKYQKTHPNVSLVFITPYLTIEYQQTRLQFAQMKYDSILYPNIEDKPKRYAITYRNRYMVEQADYIVAYITHDWGRAYTTYQYAQRKGKEIFNLATF